MTLAGSIILTLRVLKQILRDHRTFAMMTVIPIVITIVFGYALGGTVENVPVIAIVEDKGAEVQVPNPINPNINLTLAINLGQTILEKLKTDKRLAITVGADNLDARKNVDQEKAFAVINIPENFSVDIAYFAGVLVNASTHTIGASQPELFLYLDGTRPTLLQGIMAALQNVFTELQSLNPTVAKLLPRLTQEFANGIFDLKPLDVSIPVVIALILNFLILLFSTLFLVRENTYKTKGRLLATSIRPREIILGYSIALTVLAVLMSLSVLVISVFIFNVKVFGDLIELLICIAIFGTTFVFLGLFLSNFARNELQAIQMGPLVAFPSMALSGFLVPVEMLPSFLQPFSAIIPMTYGIKLFRGIMLKGYNIVDILPDFLAVIIFAVLFLTLAIFTIKGTTD
jgi:ABC-2 type transport system permease protein